MGLRLPVAHRTGLEGYNQLSVNCFFFKFSAALTNYTNRVSPSLVRFYSAVLNPEAGLYTGLLSSVDVVGRLSFCP